MSTFDFAKRELELSSGKRVGYYSLKALEEKGFGNLSNIPKSIKILSALPRHLGAGGRRIPQTWVHVESSTIGIGTMPVKGGNPFGSNF